MAAPQLFDLEWYLRNNPDVAAAVDAGLIDAQAHFDLFGKYEGRSPAPVFDPAYYLSRHPDIATAVEAGLITAYDHFLEYGQDEGRVFVSYFDSDFYLRRNPDVAEAVEQGLFTATEHFLRFGQGEPRAISPFFDLGAYMAANPDVGQAAQEGVIGALDHLLSFGFAEGRPLGNGVSLAQFANDPVFQAALSEGGSPFDALARVAEVAPFLPGFQPPEGWQAPADTPIPLDFVPVEGERLVIPPSVEVPDDVDLPDDVFEPVAPEPGPRPEPRPEPEPEPDPGPAPGPDPYVVAAAGKPTGADNAFMQGDTLIVVFNEGVLLAKDSPFTAQSAALLGEGYTIERASFYDKGDLPADQGPIAQYRVVLGSEPSLGGADELVLRPQAVTNAAGAVARADIRFQAANHGVLVLDEAVSYPDWFRLAHDVDYALRAEAHNVVLANLDSVVVPVSQHVTGSDGDDYFYATHTDALRGPGDRKLTLDGGDGTDTLTARLDETTDYSKQAPTITNIEKMQLQAAGAHITEVGLKFTHISGVEEVWNQSVKHALTLVDLREQLRLGAESAGSESDDGVDYIARYGDGVALPEVQEVALVYSNIKRLGITGGFDSGLEPVSAGIERLEIQLRGENRIASFTEDAGTGYHLSDSLKVIGLTRLDGAPADEDLLLELGQVWGGLTIDMSALKSGGGGALSLQHATVSGALTVTMAELAHETWGDKGDVGDGSPGNRKSEMGIVLPRLDALDGAAITLQNLTVASTGAYTHAPQENDIIALTSWNLADAAALAGLVSSIRISEGAGLSAESGGLNYVNVAVEFDRNGDSVTDFTLTLENLVSAQVYNTMLAALDTVNAHDELKSTLDLIGSGIEIAAGALHDAFKFSSAEVVIERGGAPEGADPILGLVGVLVDERTIFLQEA